MRASLLMYNPPALLDANQRFWGLISARLRDVGVDAPQRLSADGFGPDFWTAKDMVFSQTCGMPYRTVLHSKVQIVGTPDYGVEGCKPGYYHSVLIKRKDDTRMQLSEFDGARVAVNGFESQSGFAALANEIADSDIRFGRCIVTGAHAASVAAVASGKADIAATDAVTWRLLSRNDVNAADVEVFARTRSTPGLPFICANTMCRETIFNAVAQAIESLPQTDQDLLMLRGLVKIPVCAYLSVPTPRGGERDLVQGRALNDQGNAS